MPTHHWFRNLPDRPCSSQPAFLPVRCGSLVPTASARESPSPCPEEAGSQQALSLASKRISSDSGDSPLCFQTPLLFDDSVPFLYRRQIINNLSIDNDILISWVPLRLSLQSSSSKSLKLGKKE